MYILNLNGNVGARLLVVFSGTDFKYISPLFATVTYFIRLFSPLRYHYHNHIAMHDARSSSVNGHRASYSLRAPLSFPLLLGHLYTPRSHPECECRRGGLGSVIVMSVVLSVAFVLFSRCLIFGTPLWGGGRLPRLLFTILVNTHTTSNITKLHQICSSILSSDRLR